jgi:hypothetical protein
MAQGAFACLSPEALLLLAKLGSSIPDDDVLLHVARTLGAPCARIAFNPEQISSHKVVQRLPAPAPGLKAAILRLNLDGAPAPIYMIAIDEAGERV